LTRLLLLLLLLLLPCLQLLPARLTKRR